MADASSSPRILPPVYYRTSLYETVRVIQKRTRELTIGEGLAPLVDPTNETSAYNLARRELLSGKLNVQVERYPNEKFIISNNQNATRIS